MNMQRSSRVLPFDMRNVHIMASQRQYPWYILRTDGADTVVPENKLIRIY